MELTIIDEDDPSESNQRLREYLRVQLSDAGHDVGEFWRLPPPHRGLASARARKESWFQAFEELRTKINQVNCSKIDDVDGVIFLAHDSIGPALAGMMGYAFARSIPIFVYLPALLDAARVEELFDSQAEFFCEQGGGRLTASTSELLAAVKFLDAKLAMRAVALGQTEDFEAA